MVNLILCYVLVLLLSGVPCESIAHLASRKRR